MHRTSNQWIKLRGDVAITEGWKIKHRSHLMEWNVNRAVAANGLREFEHDLHLRGGQRSADSGLQLLSTWLSGQETIKRGAVEHTVELLNEVDKALARLAMHDLLMAQARGTDLRDLDFLTWLWHAEASVDVGFCRDPARAYPKP